MKILLIETAADGLMKVQLGADSAVLRTGEPVFVPEPLAQWQCRVMPGVRISRLGMHISPANAARHFDSVSLFHVMTPSEPMAGIPCGVIDRTFSPGEWIPAKDIAAGRWTVTRKRIGKEADFIQSHSFTLDSLGVHDAISRLSGLCTFRTGDVLLFGDAAINLGNPVLDTCIEAALDANVLLNIRIK